MDTIENKKIYALGFFDGVHSGHQALLAACRKLAAENGGLAGVVTFTSHPDALVSGTAPMLLNDPEDRRRLLKSFGISQIVELPFDRQLMEMSWRDFIRMLRSKPYCAAGFVCGIDFRFGHMGQGTAQILSNYCTAAGMPHAVVPQQEKNGIRISSTHIRQLIEAGQLEKATDFLGHPHILSGTVISGRKLGRTIGIPTANIRIPEGVVLPPRGVYACRVQVDAASYLAVTNIGSRPTVGGHHITVEPWILDFSGDLYGKTITLEFHTFLRPEQKFGSLEELQAEIQKNALQTRNFFEKT